MAKRKTTRKKKSTASSVRTKAEEADNAQKEAKPSEQPEHAEAKPAEKKAVTASELLDAIFVSLSSEPPEGSDKKRDNLIRGYLKQGFDRHDVSKEYNILILHDEGRMVKSDADHIYSGATSFRDERPLLLVLYSTGGEIGSAYLISKLCREYSNGKFVAVVPRQAKSGATLVCCGADQIHMGSLSELGPVDPQIGQTPALGLKSSVEHIADLISQYPEASEMFAKYLHLSLEPIHLGYYERVAESATQYAERLLKTHSSQLKQSATKIANVLVYAYKDHGFVIDKGEATDIFGDKVVKTNTLEYDLGNDIYERLMFISRVAGAAQHYFYFIGSLASDPHFRKKKS